MTLQEEERLWTVLIEKFKEFDAPWKSDVVGRAFGNRGNARSRQGKMEEALVDFNEAIALCPWSPDPLLNRQVLQPHHSQAQISKQKGNPEELFCS